MECLLINSIREICYLKDKLVGYLKILSETVLNISYAKNDMDCKTKTTDVDAQYFSTKKTKFMTNNSEGIQESVEIKLAVGNYYGCRVNWI